MLALILRIAGIAAYAAILTCLGLMLCTRARDAGILRPVLVGAGARLAIVLVAHFVSIALGQHGFFYLDDQGYLNLGRALAHAWAHGHFPDPTGVDYVKSSAIGYPLLVAFVVFLVGKHVLAVALLNVLLGAASVYLLGRIAEAWWGHEAGVRAAWLLALLPTAVWWSATALKDNFAMLLVLSALDGVARQRRAPSGVRVVVPLIVLTTVRVTDAIAVAVGIGAARLVVVLRTRSRSRRSFVRSAGMTGAVLLVALLIASAGHPFSLIHGWLHGLTTVRTSYGVGGAAAVPGNVARSFIAPYPWVFTHVTFGWNLPLYPGSWWLIMLYPTALRGLWLLRERRDLFMLLVGTIALFMALNAYALGLFFRQRSSIEPLFLLLVVAGATSWVSVIRGGALALVLLAPFTLAQSKGLLVPGLVLLAAGAVWALAGRAPGKQWRVWRDPVDVPAVGPVLTATGVARLLKPRSASTAH